MAPSSASTPIDLEQNGETDMNTDINPWSANAAGVSVGHNVASLGSRAIGGVKALASAAAYVLPAIWLLGAQVCLHGREFWKGFVNGDATAMATFDLALIAVALAGLAIAHQKASETTSLQLSHIVQKLSRVDDPRPDRSPGEGCTPAPNGPSSPTNSSGALEHSAFQFVYDGGDHFTFSKR